MTQPFIKANTHIHPGYDTRDSWCVALVLEVFALKVRLLTLLRSLMQLLVHVKHK